MRMLAVQFKDEVQVPQVGGRKGISNARPEGDETPVICTIDFDPATRLVALTGVRTGDVTLVPVENVREMKPLPTPAPAVAKGGAVKATERLEKSP